MTKNLVDRLYKKCIENHLEQVNCMEQVVMKILDRNYDLLYDYFCCVLERQEEYKILRARRCQVLFQVFLPIILKNEPDIQVYGTFISSHAVAKYKEDIMKSSALILDDILIHGRGLQELYEELDAGYKNSNIHVYIHKISRNADAMTDRLKEKLECDSRVFEWEWRELSTQLVNVIQATVAPYVSFVESYIGSQEVNFEKMDSAFIICDNTNDDQKRVGTEAYVFYEKETLPQVIKSWGYDACVRYYENEKIKKAVFMPYVFMKILSKEDIHLFCTKLVGHLKNKYKALEKELLKPQDIGLDLKYKAYLVNVLLNRIYGLYLNHKYQGLFDFSVGDGFTLAMCFGDGAANDIKELVYEDICGLMDMVLCQSQQDAELEEDPKLIEGLAEAKKDKAADGILSLYFYYNRQLDEDSARRREKRNKGLSIKTFYEKLDDDVHEAGRLQLKSWDAGIAACDIFVINDNVVALCARAGEQSFRFIVDALEKTKKRADEKKGQSDEENGRRKNTLEDSLIGQFLSENQGGLCEWELPKIYC